MGVQSRRQRAKKSGVEGLENRALKDTGFSKV
jgi:hypothetical protein